ncbi:MAG: hypothetical protein AAFZ49_02285 [Cyanobacteria bacterium J06659_2]
MTYDRQPLLEPKARHQQRHQEQQHKYRRQCSRIDTDNIRFRFSRFAIAHLQPPPTQPVAFAHYSNRLAITSDSSITPDLQEVAPPISPSSHLLSASHPSPLLLH